MAEIQAAQRKSNMGRAWAIVTVVFLAGVCMPANMGKTMWLASMVMPALGITEGVFGWLNGVFYVLGAIIAFPAALFIRRIGVRWTVVIALACGIVGNLLGVFAGASINILMISRIIEGAGFGLMGVAGVVAISPWFPKEKRGLPLGVWAAWVAIANAATPPIDNAIASATGDYVSVWWVYFVFDIVILVLFLAVYRNPSHPFIDEADAAGKMQFSYKELFNTKVVWFLAIAFMVEEGAFVGSQGFMQAYLTLDCGFDSGIAALLLTIVGFWGAIFAPLAGKWSDAIGSRYKILIFCMVFGLIYAILVFWVRTLPLYGVVCVVIGIVGGGVASMLWSSATEVVPSHLISGVTAALACFQSVGMFFGSSIIGGAIDAFGYTVGGWIFLIPCFLIGGLVCAIGLKGKLR